MPDINSNRLSKQSPQRQHRRMWCGGCDACLVHRDGKCPVCGFTNQKGHKRLKSKERLIKENE